MRRLLLVRGPASGGIARHVNDLAAMWRADGDAVVVCAPDAAEGVDEVVAVPGAWSGAAAAWRPLTRLVRGADLVHAHGLRAGLITAAAARRSGVASVVTVHNRVDATTGGAAWRLTRLAERGVAPLADVTIGASADITARLGPTARTIHVAAPPRRPQRPRAQTRSALGVTDAEILVLAVARLHPQKDLATLVAAARRLADDGIDDVVVAIAGDGPEHAALGAQIAASGARVRLLGARDDVADLYAAADIAVLTSVWEAVPLSLKEAARAGLALVGTATGGIGELVRDGETGLVVPVGDVAAVAGAIARLRANPELRARLGAAARAHEAAAFSHAAMRTALRGAYDDAFAQHRRPAPVVA